MASEQSEGRIEAPSNNTAAASDNFDRAELYEGVASLSSSERFGSTGSTRGGSGTNINDGTLSGNSGNDQQGTLDRGMAQTASLYGDGARAQTSAQGSSESRGSSDGTTVGSDGTPRGADTAGGSDASLGVPPESEAHRRAGHTGQSGESAMHGSAPSGEDQAAIQDGLSVNNTASLYREQSLSQFAGSRAQRERSAAAGQGDALAGGTPHADASRGANGEALSATAQGDRSAASGRASTKGHEITFDASPTPGGQRDIPQEGISRAMDGNTRVPDRSERTIDGSVGPLPSEQAAEVGKAVDGKEIPEDPARRFPVSGGGELALNKDGTAALTDGNGESSNYKYFSTDNNGWHVLYQPGATAGETAESMRSFRTPEQPRDSVEFRDTKWSAADWSKLSPVQQRAVNEALPPSSVPIGMGVDRVAWQTPDNQAVVLGPNEARPDAPFLLQSTKTQDLGNKKLEWFPLGDSSGITKGDVDSFNKKWESKGWEIRDEKTQNYVRLSDGSMWRVDPDSIERSASGDVTPGTSDATQMHGVSSGGTQNERDQSPKGLRKYMRWLF
jgi:hypothetical protein